MRRVTSTGIGSLPFTESERALDHVFARYGLPFYPQLPQVPRQPQLASLPQLVREVLSPEAAEALRPGRGRQFLKHLWRDDAFAVVDGLPGFGAFVRRAKLEGRGAKGQLAGPRTLAAFAGAIFGDEVPTADLLLGAREWLGRLVPAYATKLTLVVLDDFLLAAAASSEDAIWVSDLEHALRARGVRLGLHSCAPLDAARALARFSGLILAFDLSVIDLLAARAAISPHFAAGGGLILGIFDTRSEALDVPRGMDLARRAYALMPESAEIFISGGCGTGLHAASFEYELALALAGART